MRVVRGDVSDPNVAVIDLPVTVSKKYLNTVRKPIITADIPNWRGLVVDYATASPTFAQLVERPPADSLYVADVVQDSPSWQAGIRVGSFITHVGDLKVSTPIEFAELVQGITDEVTLHVTSNGTDTTPRTVSP